MTRDLDFDGLTGILRARCSERTRLSPRQTARGWAVAAHPSEAPPIASRATPDELPTIVQASNPFAATARGERSEGWASPWRAPLASKLSTDDLSASRDLLPPEIAGDREPHEATLGLTSPPLPKRGANAGASPGAAAPSSAALVAASVSTIRPAGANAGSSASTPRAGEERRRISAAPRLEASLRGARRTWMMGALGLVAVAGCLLLLLRSKTSPSVSVLGVDAPVAPRADVGAPARTVSSAMNSDAEAPSKTAPTRESLAPNARGSRLLEIRLPGDYLRFARCAFTYPLDSSSRRRSISRRGACSCAWTSASPAQGSAGLRRRSVTSRRGSWAASCARSPAATFAPSRHAAAPWATTRARSRRRFSRLSDDAVPCVTRGVQRGARPKVDREARGLRSLARRMRFAVEC